MNEPEYDYRLSSSALRRDFDAAQKAGDDFMLVMAYYSDGEPLISPDGVECFNTTEVGVCEETLSFNVDRYLETFRDYLTERPDAEPVAAYDLRKAFDEAQFDHAPLESEFNQVRQDVEYQKSMDERPLWRKVLHLGPAGGS